MKVGKFEATIMSAKHKPESERCSQEPRRGSILFANVMSAKLNPERVESFHQCSSLLSSNSGVASMRDKNQTVPFRLFITRVAQMQPIIIPARATTDPMTSRNIVVCVKYTAAPTATPINEGEAAICSQPINSVMRSKKRNMKVCY